MSEHVSELKIVDLAIDGARAICYLSARSRELTQSVGLLRIRFCRHD